MLKLWFVFCLVAVVLSLGRGYLTDPKQARNALVNAGYSHPVLIGSHKITAEWRGCSKSDAAQYIFRAINPTHKLVTVKVCVGWPFKGATIRY